MKKPAGFADPYPTGPGPDAVHGGRSAYRKAFGRPAAAPGIAGGRA